MSSLSKYAPLFLGVLRIVVALLFIEHGTQKLLGFPAPMQIPGGLPPLLVVAGFLEIAGGILLLLGLFTRPVAFILSGEMAVAFWMMHFPRGGLYPVLNGGDAAVLFCFVFLYLVFAGPGALSVDSLRRGR